VRMGGQDFQRSKVNKGLSLKALDGQDILKIRIWAVDCRIHKSWTFI
jgi:hypothetical protein